MKARRFPVASSVLSFAGALCTGVCLAQGQPRPPMGPGVPPPPQNGPWNADVLVYSLPEDGLPQLLARFERAGVPTLARMKDGRLIAAHQHFPAGAPEDFDKVAVHFSADDGKTWSAPQVIRVVGLPEELRFPFDPTLVPLPDGRVRLYFTSRQMRQHRELPAIYSAISEDGVAYRFEPGVRFAIDGRPVIDCAAVLHKGTYHLYAPDNGAGLDPLTGWVHSRVPAGSGYHATSTDGLKFTRVDDVRAGLRQRWLGNAQSDGTRITFFGTADPELPGGSGLWRATSADGQTWRMESTQVVFGGDPGIAASKSNGWVMVITGPPKPGTIRRRTD